MPKKTLKKKLKLSVDRFKLNMPKIFREADKEDVEVLDITGTAANVMTRFQKACKDLTKEPVTKQAAVGGASGW